MPNQQIIFLAELSLGLATLLSPWLIVNPDHFVTWITLRKIKAPRIASLSLRVAGIFVLVAAILSLLDHIGGWAGL
jgi:hypothetical protein